MYIRPLFLSASGAGRRELPEYIHHTYSQEGTHKTFCFVGYNFVQSACAFIHRSYYQHRYYTSNYVLEFCFFPDLITVGYSVPWRQTASFSSPFRTSHLFYQLFIHRHSRQIHRHFQTCSSTPTSSFAKLLEEHIQRQFALPLLLKSTLSKVPVCLALFQKMEYHH